MTRFLATRLSIVLLVTLGASFACAQDLGGQRVSAALKANLDLPYDALVERSSEDEEKAPQIVSFFGASYETEAIIFCLDRSSSMADAGGWEDLQRELARAVSELSEDTDFGLVFFGEDTKVYPESKKPARATEAEKKSALEFARALAPQSWTCLLPGLSDALTMAQASRKARRTVVLLSDGKPTCQGVNYFEYLDQVRAEARSRAGATITIHTIGTGADVNDPFLSELARTHRGTYRRAR